MRSSGASVPAWWRWALLAWCAALLFVRLGHYPLWDDEACTALLAENVWRTGDTVATSGPGVAPNVMAYGKGRELEQTRGGVVRDRFQAPLQVYVMAPFIGAMGRSSLAARLPFALVGLGEVALLIAIARRAEVSRRQWLIFAALLATCVPMFLYLRQGRYYALSILALTWAGWTYFRWPARVTAREAWPVGVALAMFPLISAQFAATFAPLFIVDYALFGWRRSRLSARGWGALFAPGVAATALVLWRWNPLGAEVISAASWEDKATMVWRAFRDLNNAHLGVGALLLAAPAVAWLRRDLALTRALVAIVIACVVDGSLDPQSVEATDFAEVRHLCPLIPLAMYVAAVVVEAAWAWRWLVGGTLLPLAALTNVLNWGALLTDVRTRSIQYEWARELITPPLDPYTVAIRWVRDRIPAGATVGVDPDYMRYPLMFHCPDKVYSWQIDEKFRGKLPGLPARQFMGTEPPAYWLMFGLQKTAEKPGAEDLAGVPYRQLEWSKVYWRDLYRPEIVLRRFRGGAEELTNPYTQGIYLYGPPITSGIRPSPKP